MQLNFKMRGWYIFWPSTCTEFSQADPMRLVHSTIATYFGTWQKELGMEKCVARVGKNNRTQVVTIPLEFRFPEEMKEVFIRKVGDELILSPRPSDWSAFLASDLRVSDDFMSEFEDLPVQERSVFP
jgi:antitoxin VapB